MCNLKKPNSLQHLRSITIKQIFQRLKIAQNDVVIVRKANATKEIYAFFIPFV